MEKIVKQTKRATNSIVKNMKALGKGRKPGSRVDLAKKTLNFKTNGELKDLGGFIEKTEDKADKIGKKIAKNINDIK